MATIALYANQINQMPGRIKDVKKSVIDYKAELSALKTKTLTINKSVCDLEDVIRSIQTSTQTQEQKSTSLDTFNNNCEDFIAEVVRIDGDVADVIRQRKDDFYKKYSYLKPECEKNGWEKFKEGCRKAGQWCKDHWKAIATVAIIIAAVILVVAFPYAAPLLLLMAKGAILGAVIGGVAGGVISTLGGNSFWEGFENGAFAGAIAGIIGGGMTGMYAMPAILAKTAVKLSLGETLFIGGATGAGTSLIGDIGDIFIKGENLSIGQVLFNMGVSGALGVLFAGIGYGIAKGFAALKVKLFSGKPNINSGPVKGSSQGAGRTIISPEMEQKILEGQRVGNTNKIIGGHSSEINNSNPIFAVEEIKVNSDGTKVIKYVKQFSDGNVSRIKTSTVFPDTWPESQIIESIKTVGDTPPIGSRASDGLTLHRGTINNVQIDVIKSGDNVISGYPVGGSPTTGFDPIP